MKQIKRLFRIHRIFVAQELKRMMEYKGDFIVGVVSTASSWLRSSSV